MKKKRARQVVMPWGREPLTEAVYFRLAPTELEAIRKCASRKRITMAAFLREAAREKCLRLEP